jgi:Uma2 family endonuclease
LTARLAHRYFEVVTVLVGAGVSSMSTLPQSLTSPPLEPGDRLTRAEFERRYQTMSNVKKAELINGVVHMPSPVRLRRHGDPHVDLVTCLGTYRSYTPGVIAGDNTTVRLDLENEPQPDALLLIDPKCGGQARISEDDYVERAPELVSEISSSSVSFDLHTKLAIYRRAGVREYVVWRVADGKIDWFANEMDEFVPMVADAEGVIRSRIFPGLWLDATGLVDGDMTRVLAVLQRGIASPEHADFVRELQCRSKPT